MSTEIPFRCISLRLRTTRGKTSNEDVTTATLQVRDLMALLLIVGSGTQIARDLTIEACECINESNVTFSLFSDLAELRRICPTATILEISQLYRDCVRDDENYSRIVTKVGEALDSHQKVCLVLPGDSLFGVSLVHLLKQAYPLAHVRSIPGISSFCHMSHGLGRDALEHGTLLVDANRLLLYRYALDARNDVFVYHVCSVATSIVNFTNPSELNRWDLLQEYLLQYYPAGHQVHLVHAPTSADDSFHSKPVLLGTLQSYVKDVNYATTLFIPGIKSAVMDTKYLALLLRQSQADAFE